MTQPDGKTTKFQPKVEYIRDMRQRWKDEGTPQIKLTKPSRLETFGVSSWFAYRHGSRSKVRAPSPFRVGERVLQRIPSLRTTSPEKKFDLITEEELMSLIMKRRQERRGLLPATVASTTPVSATAKLDFFSRSLSRSRGRGQDSRPEGTTSTPPLQSAFRRTRAVPASVAVAGQRVTLADHERPVRLFDFADSSAPPARPSSPTAPAAATAAAAAATRSPSPSPVIDDAVRHHVVFMPSVASPQQQPVRRSAFQSAPTATVERDEMPQYVPRRRNSERPRSTLPLALRTATLGQQLTPADSEFGFRNHYLLLAEREMKRAAARQKRAATNTPATPASRPSETTGAGRRGSLRSGSPVRFESPLLSESSTRASSPSPPPPLPVLDDVVLQRVQQMRDHFVLWRGVGGFKVDERAQTAAVGKLRHASAGDDMIGALLQAGIVKPR